MRSVHKKVIGYGKTPTATAKLISPHSHHVSPEVVSHEAIIKNRLIPRIFNIANEPKNKPERTRKTLSRLFSIIGSLVNKDGSIMVHSNQCE